MRKCIDGFEPTDGRCTGQRGATKAATIGPVHKTCFNPSIPESPAGQETTCLWVTRRMICKKCQSRMKTKCAI